MKQNLIRQALVVYKKWEYPKSPFRFEHQKTLKTVQAVLKKYQIPFKQISRRSLKNKFPVIPAKLVPEGISRGAGISHIHSGDSRLRGNDKGIYLIITVGGDGTFLHASHFSDRHQLLLGVNSAPGVSVGAYCSANRKSFEKILLKILKKKARIVSLYRLQVTIRSHKIPILALNDILIANPIPAGTARYVLKVGKKQEEQKSSGIWISTASGSTAAIRSAGGKLIGHKMSKFQFVVRELFSHQGKKFKLKKGILNPSHKLTLISRMPKTTLFIDGAHVTYKIKYGETVKVEWVKNPVRVVL